MAQPAEVSAVETGDEYIHVRFRDPDDFETIRTPDWAQNAATSVSEGSEVRTGKLPDADEWKIQSVLIDKHVGAEKAAEQATEIVATLES